ncbi:NAD(P)/FAD-dependent oxidoreductase [Saccharomonospora sp.]|uniref:phytoene desaturase family protein n=1 Tax=Saccharomonospora sp. TaxID=33913 RepID=UPI0026146FED|nr:NAD(P)/FAD-dependent oxidoreductase [Saccharomonospora sp.]
MSKAVGAPGSSVAAGDTVDAVVIGAGQNGLVAANLLADAGWDVLVLEATPYVGGAVRTAELTEPGFRHDVFSAFYPLSVTSPVIRGLDLEQYGLRWRHAPAVLAHVLPDDRAAVLSRDLEATVASLSTFDARDGEAWRLQFDQWLRVKESLLDTLFSPFPPVRPASRLVRTLGLADGLRFARMLAMPVRALGEETYRGDGARLLLAGNALHSDLGPDTAGSSVFGWLLTMLGQDVGFPVPEGGAGGLTEALAARLRTRGGRIECSRAVTRVLVARGRAVGVRDEHGSLVRARKAVLADVPAPVLYRELVGEEHLPSRLLSDLENFQWDDATVKVDWALSGPIPWSNPDVGRAGTVHLDSDLDGLSRYSAELTSGQVPVEPMLVLGQMTTTDPTRSPEGTEVAWAYTHVPQGLAWDRDRVRRFVDRMEHIVERHAPGFTACIRNRHVLSPTDLHRWEPSLVGGAINGGTAALHQQLVFRPVPGMGRSDTPVDRLYLASASAHPGGAVHGGPGSNAAKAALARAGLAGAAYGRLMRSVHVALYPN